MEQPAMKFFSRLALTGKVLRMTSGSSFTM